ncbi:hypothetical protein, partial [Sphingomonas panni]|uniref:hypothetical protein n=1 Tax=Sphingomonas panni TaxID=237612 RepID=UPI001F5BBAE4
MLVLLPVPVPVRGHWRAAERLPGRHPKGAAGPARSPGAAAGHLRIVDDHRDGEGQHHQHRQRQQP